jgi:alpha-beta hydrolase superfamily lysophospholipase
MTAIRNFLVLVLLIGLWGCQTEPVSNAPQEAVGSLQRAHFRTQDGLILPVRTYWPPKGAPEAIVIAIHGLNDYSFAFDGPGRFLRQHQLGLIAYDQRGFGMAPGRGIFAGATTYAEDLSSLVRAVHQRYPGIPVILLGESMGGAVAIAAFTLKKPPEVQGVILSAPAVWSRDTMPVYQQMLLALASMTVPSLELTGSGLKVQASDNINMLRELGRDPWVIKATRVDAIAGLADLMDMAQSEVGQLRTPVLILYGLYDEIIPKPPIDRLIEKLIPRKNVRTVLYPEGYHLLLRDLHADIPLGDMLAWLKNNRAPLPSGFEVQKHVQGLHQ